MSTNNENNSDIVEKRRIESGRRLKKARDNEKLTQDEAAKAIGVDRSTYGKYEKGMGTPSVDDYLKLGDLFEVNPIDLMAIDIVPSRSEVEKARDQLSSFQREAIALEALELDLDESRELLRSALKRIEIYLKNTESLPDDP